MKTIFLNYLEFYNVKQKNEFRKSHQPDFSGEF